MRKDSPKNMAKESLMLHLQKVNCTAYHRYRRGYIKITEYMPEKKTQRLLSSFPWPPERTTISVLLSHI